MLGSVGDAFVPCIVMFVCAEEICHAVDDLKERHSCGVYICDMLNALVLYVVCNLKLIL